MKRKSLFEFIEAFANSHVGSVRSENQDFFGVVKSDSFQAFFVADGMGGAKGGQVAASECVKKMCDSLKELTFEPTVDDFKKLTRAANQHIYNMAMHSPDLRGMGTTMVGLTFCKSRVLMVSVGDSRVYRYRGGKLFQLSVDHTVWNDLVTSGSITPSSDFAQEISHMLTRSIGPDDDVEPDVSEIQVEAGDTYLLCSDGLYNMVTEGEMVQALRLSSAGKSIDKLIKLANSGGGKDNITALVVKVKKGAYGVFPSCKEDLPGLRQCDLMAVEPALQSVSAKVEEAAAMADNAANEEKKDENKCRRRKTKGQTIASMPMAANRRIVPYLVAGSILALSMLSTVIFGIGQGLLKPNQSVSESPQSCKVDRMTDDQVFLALKNRKLSGIDSSLTAAHESLIALLGSSNCNLTSDERSAALGVLSLALQGQNKSVAENLGEGQAGIPNQMTTGAGEGELICEVAVNGDVPGIACEGQPADSTGARNRDAAGSITEMFINSKSLSAPLTEERR
jgi:protein phosphatase